MKDFLSEEEEDDSEEEGRGRGEGERKQLGLSGVRQERCFKERHGTRHEFQHSLVFV